MRVVSVALLFGALSSCATFGATPTPNSGAAKSDAGAQSELPKLDFRSVEKRPPLVVIARDGDPKAALAVAVATDGGAIESAALAALVEARLHAAGVSDVDARWDRAGYRVRLLVGDADEARKAIASLMTALTSPVAEDAAGKKLATARVNALKAKSLDDAALSPIASCSGELSILATDSLPDLSTAAGATQLEAWRGAAHGMGALAISIVGPTSIAAAVEESIRKTSELPQAKIAADVSSPESTHAAYVEPTRRRGTAKLSIALRMSDRASALSFAEHAGDEGSPLGTRLATLPIPFHLRSVGATVRRTGACAFLEAESDADDPSGSRLSQVAALATLVIRQEISLELGLAHFADETVAARQIRAIGDPRDAASAAAWWALSQPGTAGAAPIESVALAVAPPPTSPKSGATDSSDYASAISKRYAEALSQAESSWKQPALESRARVENGQGEVWLLVASTCPTLEADGDAGLAALGALAAARSSSSDAGISIEPWVTASGVGLLARAKPAATGEPPETTATRAADALGRAFSAAPTLLEIDAARAALLTFLDRTGERSRDPIAQALAGGQASRLAPWGLFDSVARESAESVRLRWSTLGTGPLRVSVLASDSARQADAAVRAIDRWMPRGATARRCPPTFPLLPPQTGSHLAALPPHRPSRAFVAVPVNASGDAAPLAELTALSLAEPEGVLTHALEDTGTHAVSYLLGSGAASALVIEISGPDASLEAASAQARALIGRLSRGALGEADLSRLSTRFRALDLDRHLSPRSRVIDLWIGAQVPAAPSLASWRSWLASELQDDHVAVLIARVPESAPTK